MVNSAALSAVFGKIQMARDTGGHFMKCLFTADNGLQKFWDVEEIEPEGAVRSRRLIMDGMKYISTFTGMVNTVEKNPREFRQNVHDIGEDAKEKEMKLEDVQKYEKGFLLFFEDRGIAVDDAFKKEFTAFFAEVAKELQEVGF